MINIARGKSYRIKSLLRSVFNKLLMSWSIWTLVSCSSVSNATPLSLASPTLINRASSPTATSLSILIPTSTIAPTHAKTPTSSATITPSPTESYSVTSTQVPEYFDPRKMLGPGTYFVYGQDATLFVRSLDGHLDIQLLPDILAFFGASVSPDGNQVAFSDYDHRIAIFDLSTGEISLLPQPSDSPFELGYIDPQWHLNSNMILYVGAIGPPPYNAESMIFLTSLDEDYTISLTPFQGSEYAPAWSPDGKWIAFVSDHAAFEGEYPPYDKVYLMNTTCFSDPTGCMDGLVAIGDMTDANSYNPSWSPDSERLAFTCVLEGKSGICISDKDGSNLTLIFEEEKPSDEIINALDWSPDGKYIAFTRNERIGTSYAFAADIYVIPPEGGEPINLTNTPDENEYFSFWMVIPWPFNPGNGYTTTDEGANLNLRSEPSLESIVLRRLQPGDQITVLNGPIRAEGYTWWEVQTVDGMKGWVVNIPEWYQPTE